MRIIGIGTDIVQLSRIRSLLQKHGSRFAKRILHKNELTFYAAHTQPESYLAKRFAAKEAVAKALGTGIGHSVRLTEIETSNDQRGKPLLLFHGGTCEFTKQQGVQESFISLSDERDYAIAYVILTGEDKPR